MRGMCVSAEIISLDTTSLPMSAQGREEKPDAGIRRPELPLRAAL